MLELGWVEMLEMLSRSEAAVETVLLMIEERSPSVRKAVFWYLVGPLLEPSFPK
jgi:hypothetical protein